VAQVLPNRSPRMFVRRTLALLLAVVVAFSVVSPAQSRPEWANKVERLLQGSSYKFKHATGTAAANVWIIDFTGKSLPTFEVRIAGSDDLVVIFVTIARKRQLNVNADFLYKLARFNNDLDRVKVGIDDDGDLFVRADVSVRTLDLEELKAQVDQVA